MFSLKKFLRISRTFFLRNSPEFQRIFQYLVTKLTERCKWIRELVSRNSGEIFWNLPTRNSWEILWNASLGIPDNFSGLGLQINGFLREIKKRISFKKFLRISGNFSSRNSREYFTGNFWEILGTWSSS